MARSCVFCKRTPVSQEHALPRWLAGLFTDEVVEFHRSIQYDGEAPRVQPWKGKPFSVTVGGPCSLCNHGWMADLEDRAAPLLKPMVENRPQRLGALAQELVATWAIKTMLMLRLVTSPDDGELGHDSYRWMYEKQCPLPQERVWIASYAGEGQWPASFNYWGVAMAAPGEEPTEPNAHCASFAVGHLAFGLAGHTIRAGSPTPHTQLPAGACRLVWPTTGDEVTFPPPEVLRGDEELKALGLPREWLGDRSG